MSREDKRISAPTEEEKFFSGIKGIPLIEWPQGKEFIVTDDRALLIFDAYVHPGDTAMISLKGKELKYAGVRSKMNVAGQLNLVIDFLDRDHIFTYDTGKEFDVAMQGVSSSDIPMLIDEEMVEEARKKLTGQHLWTKSSLWYDSDGNRIDGKRYVPVTITDVKTGNMVFPLMIEIKEENGEGAFMFMNFGNSPTESRSFHNLFSLSDIRKQYPAIEQDLWEYISNGKVKLGMTKEECRLALGNPTEVNSGHDYSQTLDLWNYDDGTVLWFEDGHLTRFRK